MQEIKEKVSNAASSGRAHVDIFKAKAEEKAEREAARTEEEKEIAHQRRKAKEAKAKMELHQAKAEHADEKLRAKQSLLYYGPNLTAATGIGNEQPAVAIPGQGHRPVGLDADPLTGTVVPTYPLGGNPTPPGHKKHTY